MAFFLTMAFYLKKNTVREASCDPLLKELTSGFGCFGPGSLEWRSSRRPRPAQTCWFSWGRSPCAWCTSPGVFPAFRWRSAPAAWRLAPLQPSSRGSNINDGQDVWGQEWRRSYPCSLWWRKPLSHPGRIAPFARWPDRSAEPARTLERRRGTMRWRQTHISQTIQLASLCFEDFWRLEAEELQN